MVAAFVGMKLGDITPNGVDAISTGSRIFFSFSAVAGRKGLSKTRDRIRAVPDDRLLIETDLKRIQSMNVALADVVQLVAQAKGWTIEHTIRQTWSNFQLFYEGFLLA
jgi:Tat protein secretion system quality control protein TatD with DNase activity